MHKSEFQMAEPRVQRVDAKTIDVTRMIWLLIKEIQVEFLSGFQNYFVPMTLSNHSFFFFLFLNQNVKKYYSFIIPLEIFISNLCLYFHRLNYT